MSRFPRIRRLLRERLPIMAGGAAAALVLVGGAAPAVQDRFALSAPNGVSFGEFRGYRDWAPVAVSQVADGIKVIAANPTMIAAYRAGVPDNGKPFPDGSAIVKIEWSQKKNPQSPYPVTVPDALMSVSFIEKDTKRFAQTGGWGYAQFLYDPAARAFRPYGKDASFAQTVCFKCHTAVTGKDYIYTAYPKR